ncbi:MAG: carboxypeptidase regulatory-like domain-containing protein [Acidimicrobiia bacterium]|nr:carboxypeptidase regulatory-like domain-containing protein [Acidimicrobiia bacterium]
MPKRMILIACFVLLFIYGIVAQRRHVEAIEIGRQNTELLPQGKEADGIVGDFVLRNNRVEALISGSMPLRRANMSTEYGFVTQGCLYDFDLRGESNDQLTAFRPGDFGGEISHVRIVDDGSNGAAVIEAVRTAAKGEGFYTRHEYRLEPDWRHILVTSTYRNEGPDPKEVTPRPAWKGLVDEKQAGVIRVGDSVDAFDKRAYAWGPADGTTDLPEKISLKPREEKVYRVVFAVSDSPLAAFGVLAGLKGNTGEVTGTARDPTGSAPIHARLLVSVNGETLPHYPDASGKFSVRLPAGNYRLRFEDIGRDPLERSVSVRANQTTSLNLEASAASAVRVAIRDETGGFSPGKVQFLGLDGTPDPDFGTDYRAHGNNHQYQTHDGRFTQQISPGKYLVRVTRGPEFDLFETTIDVVKGQTVDVNAELRRTVNTTGWVSADYHAHSTPSGDNYCNTNDRLINFAAEHIEFAPTTEHNRIYDWKPHIERLGLGSRIKTVSGIELTGSGQHFNSFPLRRDPYAQDGGAPVWDFDPRINAIVLRSWGTPSLEPGGSRYDTGINARNRVALFGGGPGRWVQANHPDVGTVFFDRDQDGIHDGGFVGFERLIDAAEVWSTEILNLNPAYEGKTAQGVMQVPNRTFGWLQMLNQGRHVWCVAVSDAHRIFGNGVGNWRTYVPSSTDNPPEIKSEELIRNSKAGRMMITNGPFLEVTTGDGLPIGSTIIAEGYVDLKIRVQAPNWIAVDRVQVLVNGRQPEQYNLRKASHPGMFKNGVLRFDETVRIQLQQDAHLIVVAVGESADLSKGWGKNPQGAMRPTAYTNPIYADIDHNGFQASGDTLGHPLMTSPARR